jgi:hypothetical protein
MRISMLLNARIPYKVCFEGLDNNLLVHELGVVKDLNSFLGILLVFEFYEAPFVILERKAIES